MNSVSKPSETQIQMPETTKATANDSVTMSGPLVSHSGAAADFLATHGLKTRRKSDPISAFLRLLCIVSSITAIAFMVSAHSSGSVPIYGFNLQVDSKWSFSDSFEYLVGVSAAACAHSLLQLLLSVAKLWKGIPVIPSRNHAWLIFAGDQIFAYAMMSAGSAAAGVTNLNRTGVKHSAFPDFCKPLHRFCDRVAVSIAFAFLGAFMLASSAIFDVIWLSKY
ncbi:hypothetical protein AMTRI_Chr05g57870 [Amborella trichopoda]